jgi:hypothetical protein
MIKFRIFHKILMWFLLSVFIFSFVTYESSNKVRIKRNKLFISISNMSSKVNKNKKTETVHFKPYSINTLQEHRKILTRGTARVPIENSDTASARRVAIVLSIRNAVERGYGFYIQLNNLPNQREILQRAAAQVAYSIVEEGEKDNNYEVTIEAEILVPVDLIDKFPASPPSSDMPSGYEPFVVKHQHGEINWGEGYVIAEGLAAMQKGDTPEQVELLSERAALIDAEANILEIIYNIRVDSENIVREAVNKNKEIFFKIEGMIQGAEVIEEFKEDNIYKVKIKVPITGVKGLGIACYQLAGKEAPLPSEIPEAKPAEAEETKVPEPAVSDELTGVAGVIIDARETDFEACLYPKIITEQGMEVYSVEHVSKDSLIEKGMASYAVVIEKGSQLYRENLPLITQQQQRGMVKLLSTYAPAIHFINKAHYNRLFFDEIDDTYNQHFVIKASRAEGSLRGTIVINQSQAEKLMEMDKESGLLNKCNVIIIVPVSENKDTRSNSSDLRRFQTLYMGMH